MSKQNSPDNSYSPEASKAGLNKLEFNTASLAGSYKSNDETTAIVKVSQAGYVPPGIECRAKISPNLFTAKMHKADIERLQRDPLVISVGSSKRLRSLSQPE